MREDQLEAVKREGEALGEEVLEIFKLRNARPSIGMAVLASLLQGMIIRVFDEEDGIIVYDGLKKKYLEAKRNGQ